MNLNKSQNNKILYHGDNLNFIRNIPSLSIDLIYADIPFNTGRKYFLPKQFSNISSQIQEKIFCFDDSWSKYQEIQKKKENIFDEIINQFNSNSELQKRQKNLILHQYHSLRTIAKTIGISYCNYLDFLFLRMQEFSRILSEKGSIYIHCNQKMSHFIRLIMDILFHKKNFRNEIIFQTHKGGRFSSHRRKSFGTKIEPILFYSKNKNFNFKHNTVKIKENQKPKIEKITLSKNMERKNMIYKYKNYTPQYGWSMNKDKLKLLDENGMLHWSKNNKPYKKNINYDQKSKMIQLQNIWTDINLKDKIQRTYYPTQKPLELLIRIIDTSCPSQGIILDPFCGSGTTIIAAEMTKRRWIGCDKSNTAIEITTKELKKHFNLKKREGYKFIKQLNPNSGEVNKNTQEKITKPYIYNKIAKLL